LREIPRIQSDQEIGPALFCTPTKAIVPGIGRDLAPFPHGHLFYLFFEEIYQPPSYVRANLQPLRYLLMQVGRGTILRGLNEAIGRISV
jgi:hypothetical protein